MSAPHVATFDARAFRTALGHFATGVAVVTAPAAEGPPLALTISSFNAVSLDPPLVLFSVGRSAPSLPGLLAAPHFGVAVLRDDQAELSHRFAYAREAKWSGLEARPGRTGCPLVGTALATFECAPFATHDGGDHVIIVGRVLSFESAAEGTPLLFFRGAYHALAERAA